METTARCIYSAQLLCKKNLFITYYLWNHYYWETVDGTDIKTEKRTRDREGQEEETKIQEKNKNALSLPRRENDGLIIAKEIVLVTILIFISVQSKYAKSVNSKCPRNRILKKKSPNV